MKVVVIPRGYGLPDYTQRDCCGCRSGCGAVVWAQIVRYYDSLGSNRHKTSIFSGNIYGDKRTESPKSMSYSVRRFVEGIFDRRLEYLQER